MRVQMIVLVACCVSATAMAAQKGPRGSGAVAAVKKAGRSRAAPAPKPAESAEPDAVPLAPLAPPAEPVAAPAPAEPAPAVEARPASAQSVATVALLEPPPASRVPPEALQAASRLVATHLATQGLGIVAGERLAAAYSTRRIPNCGDSPACLARIGVAAGTNFVATLSLRPVGKHFGVKLTVIDSRNGRIVSNIVTFVAQPSEDLLGDAIAKQAPRAAAAVKKHLADTDTDIALAPLTPDNNDLELTPLVTNSSATPDPEAELQAQLEAELLAELKTELAREAASAGSDAPMVSTGRSSRILSYALLGAGAAAVGVGAGVFGLKASAATKDFKAGINPDASKSDAKQWALLTDVTVGAGIALAGAGLVTLLWPDEPPAAITVAPAGAGIAVAGNF